MFRNSAANQLLKFAENRGQEINNLDRLLQAQMGLPMTSLAGQPRMTAPPQQQHLPQPQLQTAAPIQPAYFERPWLNTQAPQQPPQPTMQPQVDPNYSPAQPQQPSMTPFVDSNAPQQPPQPSMQPSVDPSYAPQQPQAPLGSQGVTLDFAMGPRRPNRPQDDVLSVIETAAATALGPGARAVITSGTEGDQPQHGSARHKTGRAADVAFYDADGKKVTSSDPRMKALARAATQGGALGIGFGEEYMGGDHMHIDLVDPAEVGGAHTWASGAKEMNDELFGGGRQAAAPAGATQRTYDRGQSVGVPQPQAPMSEEEYERRIASLEEMANQTTPQRMTNREQFSLSNFDLGGALRGFGMGLGQMSQGQAVDLGSVYNSQERRANTELELTLDRNRRTAASEMALEMGDESAAAAIAQGGIDFSQFLTQRQMEQVESRAMRNEMRDEIGRNAIFDYLAPTLGEEGARAAMYNPSTVLGFEQIMEANRRAEVARSEQQQVFQGQLNAAYAALENPNVTPTTQWASQQVINSGGQITLKDAMNMAGDDYDRFAPPEPPAPTTDMRNYEAAMGGLPPEQQVPFGEWLDRSAESSETAREEQIRLLMEANPGMTQDDATNAIVRYAVDPVGGGLVDRVTGSPVRPEFRPTTGYAPTQPLWNQADYATGMAATLARAGANVAGQIPFGIGDALVGDDNPYVMAEQSFDAANEDLSRALAMNPRNATSEVDRIIKNLGLPKGAFTSPATLRATMRATDLYMRRRLDREMQMANDPSRTDEERAGARSSAQGIATFIETMNVPQGDNGPVHLPADIEMQKDIVGALPEGALFKLPGEENYRRKVTKK